MADHVRVLVTVGGGWGQFTSEMFATFGQRD